MGFQKPTRTFQSNNFEFEYSTFTFQDFFHQVPERRLIVRCHNVQHGMPLHLLKTLCLDHVQSSAVHEYELAIGVNHFDALRLGIDNRAEPGLALQQRMLRALYLNSQCR